MQRTRFPCARRNYVVFLLSMDDLTPDQTSVGIDTPREEWRRRFEATPEREAEFSTISGAEIAPLYDAEDVGPDMEERVGHPGSYPFTRGPYPSMYRGRLWTMRQFAGFGTVEE